jgi:hypothetical protein
MPLDYAIHAVGNPIQGNHPPAPAMPVLGGQAGLAEGAESADIVVPKTGAVLRCVSTAKLRLDIQKQPTATDAAGKPTVLVTDQPALFSLPEGTYRLRTLAYV